MSRGMSTLEDVLKSNCSQLPECPGVYSVRAPEAFEPEFINPGTGGWFKRKDPNVDTKTLEARWLLCDCRVLYIGEGGKLRERVRLLLRFGQGKRVGHRGGRYLWQIRNSWSLLLHWYEHDKPQQEEKRLLNEFKRRYGRLPFANLRN